MSQLGIRSFVRTSMFNNGATNKAEGFEIFANTANSSGIELAAERVFASANGTQRIAWDLGRTVTFSLEMEVFDWSFLAMMAGQGDLNPEAFDILRRQVGSIPESGTITLLGNPAPGSLSVHRYNSETGAKGEKIEGFEITGTELTFDENIGDEVMIAYFSEVQAEVITFNADRFPPSYYIVGDFEYREAATGADKWAQLHILNARPQADLSLSLGSEVTSLAITFDALADARGDMFHIVKIDEDMEAGGGGLIGAPLA